jgi:sugar lactone lactonase YvrE
MHQGNFRMQKMVFQLALFFLITGWLDLADIVQAAPINYTAYFFKTAAGIPGLAGFQDETAINAYDALFHYPGGVTTDINGNVYVADTYNGAVRKLSAVGTNWFVTTIGTNFNYPYAVAVDRLGVVYVADTLNGVIRKLTPTTNNYVLTTLSGSFPVATGLAIDNASNIYVSEDMAFVIQKIAPNGTVSTLAGQLNVAGTNDGIGTASHFRYPNGIAVDAATNVYVADSGNNTIRKITAAGVVTTLAGKAGVAGYQDGNGTNALFTDPQGVAVDAATNVYVADFGNHTIRKISPAGVVTTLGGIPGLSGSNPGAGSGARFYDPEDVAVDNKGNIFVADEQNDAIRQGYLLPPVIAGGIPATVAGHASFNLTGLSGQTVVVQTSTNLVDWSTVWTNILGDMPVTFNDPNLSTSPQRYFRAFIP